MNTIFVGIAAYRDPELIPTLKNCLAQAAFPERLHFTIVWQHAAEDEWDTLGDFKQHPQFTIIDVDYKESQGVCWARHEMQKHYKNETYYLQLDSHHRFEENWDVKLVRMLQKLQHQGYPKPLLTTYATAYEPTKEQEKSQEPWKLNFDRFAPDGVIHTMPGGISNHKHLPLPIRARFLSAHLIFTLGEFCTEVPYDPEYYFHGEEISLAVRAYTWGYDLFHPNEVLIWHEYIRQNKSKHWSDNRWESIDRNAKIKNRKLLGIDEAPVHIETFGLGPVRSLKEYELYAGIDFRTRRVHKNTIEEMEPPVPIDNYEENLLNYKKYCIDLYKKSVPESDYDFWVIAFEDDAGVEIYREDADAKEVERILQQDKQNPFAQIWRKFYVQQEAKTWIIWPHSISKGWCERLTGLLGTP